MRKRPRSPLPRRIHPLHTASVFSVKTSLFYPLSSQHVGKSPIPEKAHRGTPLTGDLHNAYTLSICSAPACLRYFLDKPRFLDISEAANQCLAGEVAVGFNAPLVEEATEPRPGGSVRTPGDAPSRAAPRRARARHWLSRRLLQLRLADMPERPQWTQSGLAGGGDGRGSLFCTGQSPWLPRKQREGKYMRKLLIIAGAVAALAAPTAAMASPPATPGGFAPSGRATSRTWRLGPGARWPPSALAPTATRTTPGWSSTATCRSSRPSTRRSQHKLVIDGWVGFGWPTHQHAAELAA